MSIKYQVSSIKKDRIVALGVFVVLGFLALQVPINNLAGSGAKFTLFDLFAPTAGAFLGSWFGIIAVFLMGVFNLLFHGLSGVDRGGIIRLFPILFGVWFFALHSRSGQAHSPLGQARLNKMMLIVPILSIISFNVNEVGRSVWYYSLFWTIPLFVYPAVKKSLVARALASTFVAHSVGGAIWIWAFNLPASVWQGLVPVTALERSIMALGIAASYVLMNNVLVVLKNRKLLPQTTIDKKYLFIK